MPVIDMPDIVFSCHKNEDILPLFIALVKCGIGKSSELPYSPTDVQWDSLFNFACEQTLQGIAFAGIEILPNEQKPPKRLLLMWHKVSEQIKEKNIALNKKCIAVSAKFRQLGFDNCILKGQGLSRLYPDPYLRVPGDIDIWLEGGCDKILTYVRKCFPGCKPTYHHVDFPIRKGVSIEVHFTPSWMYSPIRNRKLQRFFSSVSSRQFSNNVSVPEGCFTAPTLEFDRVYLLLHIYRHLFQEGIGLRQMLDYYFVLEHGFTPEEKATAVALLKSFGLVKFASAVMYVLHIMFGLQEENFIVPPHKQRGEFLLGEIIAAGNFGKYDKRYKMVSKENELRHFLNSMRRIARLVMQYPGEALWSPYFKIWHYLWRKRYA